MTYRFIHGDCLQQMKKFPDKSVNLIITSPPYNIGLKYNKYQDNRPREEYLNWIYTVCNESKRILTDDGNLFLNIGYTNIDPWISMEIALRLKPLFILQNKITWVKSISISDDPNSSHGHFKPINSKRFITPTNEDLYHFTKDGKRPMKRLAVGVPYKDKTNLTRRKTKAVKPDLRCKGNSWFIPYKTITSKNEKGNHPAIFPLQLVEHCLKLSGLTKGIVLDPFVGSGTTIQVVKNFNETNRGYKLEGIGIDSDEKYIDYCKRTFRK